MCIDCKLHTERHLIDISSCKRESACTHAYSHVLKRPNNRRNMRLIGWTDTAGYAYNSHVFVNRCVLRVLMCAGWQASRHVWRWQGKGQGWRFQVRWSHSGDRWWCSVVMAAGSLWGHHRQPRGAGSPSWRHEGEADGEQNDEGETR